MHKVIVERPRKGGYGNKGNRRGSLPLEDLPGHESMLAGYRRRKWLGEHLGPLRRWLCSWIGRSWNEAYSEACRVIKPDSVVRANIKTHLLEMVERHTFMRNGRVCCQGYRWSPDGWAIPIEDQRHGGKVAYVHPETGLLCAWPKRSRREWLASQKRPSVVARVWVSPSRVLLKLKGCWFSCDVTAFPPRLQRGERPHQFDLATHQMVCRSQAEAIYGERVYCVAKRQLSHKELHRHGLKNEPDGFATRISFPAVAAGLGFQILRLGGERVWWLRPVATGLSAHGQRRLGGCRTRGNATQPGGLAARLGLGHLGHAPSHAAFLIKQVPGFDPNLSVEF